MSLFYDRLGFSQAHRHCFTIVLDRFDLLARLQRLHDLAGQLSQRVILQPRGLQQQIELWLDGNEIRQPIFHADQTPCQQGDEQEQNEYHNDRNAVVSPIAILIEHFGGAFPLPLAAGSRYPELALALARGERPEPRLREFRAGVVMTRFFSDLCLVEGPDGELVPFAEEIPEPVAAEPGQT